MFLLLCLIILFLYLGYEKHCETKQVESISNMNWLTYEQIEKLINKVKN